MKHKQHPLKVYYNSACPVCNAGIKNQQGKMPGCAVEWKDVHSNTRLVAEIGSDIEFVRERLHVVDQQGKLHVGWDALLTIWQHSPHEQWKAAWFGLPVIRQAGRIAYNLFAAGLYRWNRMKKHW